MDVIDTQQQQIEKLFQELEKAVEGQKKKYGLNIEEKTFMR